MIHGGGLVEASAQVGQTGSAYTLDRPNELNRIESNRLWLRFDALCGRAADLDVACVLSGEPRSRCVAYACIFCI